MLVRGHWYLWSNRSFFTQKLLPTVVHLVLRMRFSHYINGIALSCSFIVKTLTIKNHQLKIMTNGRWSEFMSAWSFDQALTKNTSCIQREPFSASLRQRRTYITSIHIFWALTFSEGDFEIGNTFSRLSHKGNNVSSTTTSQFSTDKKRTHC